MQSFLRPDDLRIYRQKLKEARAKVCDTPMVRVCCGTGCVSNGSMEVLKAFEEALQGVGEVEATAKFTGCHGFCERGPIVIVSPGEIFYQNVKPKDVHEIVQRTILRGEVIERLLYRDPVTKKTFKKDHEIPFYANQHRLVLRRSGHIDPTSIEDYIATDGYEGLALALELGPDEIIRRVTDSYLRGRGGGGFRTGYKWKSCRDAEDFPKYVIANGDEGDPGAFMDRSLMEGDPHSVIEGMIIGAYAVGAREGYIYVRNEYPLAVRRLEIAIEKAREWGLLGKNILGSPFDFDIQICKGGGAFVCGESSALMRSIEGFPGVPRVKYIHATEQGLWDKPTVLNNVETWANVPIILMKGVEWYKTLGTDRNHGTKIFALVGKVKNTGLVEVPMGVTLRKIIYDIGGGTLKDKAFKAVQTGGPSGGCIPASLLDLPVDFDTLVKSGSMMGSGGMIVMDERSCMVDVAKYFIDFLVEESCGKCTPCREGLKVLQKLLHDLSEGRGSLKDVALLEDMAKELSKTALCGLGKTAANPVLSTLKYFHEEYEEHVDGYCRAGVCQGLFVANINQGSCISCGQCAKVCPAKAISGEVRKPHVVDALKCVGCGQCMDICPTNSITSSRRGEIA
ncbi:NADH-ubiquinone oxidoreductase-F iron-sulfur binding region domain-containing protein [Acetomicrobium hydrogeniformans]|uniref:4Fe-4S binding protein n=1 Tax=Acetomicrobium hydrogeniformans TaxID=649746 RepID=A0A7V7BXQ5_9BACT|nr:NADH-ubiquinone oxidoreductase-F iron-sulfur binding region domain-containing protein [Acetomicrobium hydrogeniformans]HHZ03538.1 4Fe-4S binding protein [Acetomicrobium hydrogeniformans]